MKIKSLHFLALRAFIRPFMVTLPVLLFVFLIHHMLKYADYLTGRGVGMAEIGEVMLYSLFFLVPKVTPLAVLISSLVAFGTLGEHNELTAIKSAGISLTKIIAPVFILIIALSAGLYYYNDVVLPKTNIRVWSLMYDIKVKKAPFSLKEGAFSGGLEDFSIKVEKRSEDGSRLKNVMIYQKTDNKSKGKFKSMRNDKLIVADSGHLYTINNEHYLVLELFDGVEYREDEFVRKWSDYPETPDLALVTSKFSKNKMVIDISELALKRTPDSQFMLNKQMMNYGKLYHMADSIHDFYMEKREKYSRDFKPFFDYHFKTPNEKIDVSEFDFDRVSIYDPKGIRSGSQATGRTLGSIKSHQATYHKYRFDHSNYLIEIWYRYNTSVSCILLFLIGASIGSIVKKGGLGIPILISIIIFLFYYILTMQGQKVAKEVVVDVLFGMNICNLVLLPISIYCLFLVLKDSGGIKVNLFSWFPKAEFLAAYRELPQFNSDFSRNDDHVTFRIRNFNYLVKNSKRYKEYLKLAEYLDEMSDEFATQTDQSELRFRIQSVPDLKPGLKKLKRFYQWNSIWGNEGGGALAIVVIYFLLGWFGVSFIHSFVLFGLIGLSILIGMFWFLWKFFLNRDFQRTLDAITGQLSSLEILMKAR